MESERNLQDKIVVITGAATGIGYEIANHYLKQKAKVVIILDISEQKGKNAVEALNAKHGEGRADFNKCDVTRDIEETFAKILNKYKKIDVLINNAGVLNEDEPKKLIETNLSALIELSYKFWNYARKDNGGNGGAIVNISSCYGFMYNEYASVYTASKFGVLGFSRSLGHVVNYKKTSVRVVTLCPGFTETGIFSQMEKPGDEAWSKYLKAQIWQGAEAVGAAAVDVFVRGDSGTAWMVQGGDPIVQV